MGLCCSKSAAKHCKRRINKDGDFPPFEQLDTGNVHLIKSMSKWKEMVSEANRDDKIVVVNFSASWCNPCRSIAPAFSDLAERFPKTMCLTVDIDELAEFCTSWRIKATPTFLFLQDGRQVDKLVGADKHELLKKIAAVADLSSRSVGIAKRRN